MEGRYGRPDKRGDRSSGARCGLEIQEPDLTEVTYSLNALLEALDEINPPGLDSVEPLPIILPHQLDLPA